MAARRFSDRRYEDFPFSQGPLTNLKLACWDHSGGFFARLAACCGAGPSSAARSMIGGGGGGGGGGLRKKPVVSFCLFSFSYVFSPFRVIPGRDGKSVPN